MAPRNSPEPGAATAEDRKIVLSRVFDAPLELVWRVWTEPRHVMRWWGPQGFTSPVCRMDFRVGGSYHFCMRAPDGKDYWSTGVYQEIVEGRSYRCTDCFADEQGNRVNGSHYGMGDGWPDEMLLEVAFEAAEGGTRVTVVSTGHPGGQMGEYAKMGWSQQLDKLGSVLERSLRVRLVGDREMESLRGSSTRPGSSCSGRTRTPR